MARAYGKTRTPHRNVPVSALMIMQGQTLAGHQTPREIQELIPAAGACPVVQRKTHKGGPCVRTIPRPQIIGGPAGRLVAAVAAAAAGGVVAWGNFQDVKAAEAIPSVFSGYVGCHGNTAVRFEAPASKEAEKVVLSFVVADPKEPCSPSWGAAYSLSDAAASLDLDRRVARLQQLGGSVAVSFGGLANQELAVTCTDPAKLKSAYRAVVDRYKSAASIWTWKARPSPTPQPSSGVQWPSPLSRRTASATARGSASG